MVMIRVATQKMRYRFRRERQPDMLATIQARQKTIDVDTIDGDSIQLIRDDDEASNFFN